MTLNEMFEEHGIYLGSIAFKAVEDVTKAYIQQETKYLSQHILELQADKGNLTDRVRELEQQIEKMKYCGNCEFDNLEPLEVISNGVCEHCTNHSKWKLEN